MVDHLGDLRRRPQVVPQQRRPDHGARRVEGDHAVLLAADGDRGGPLQQPGSGLLQRFPPQLRVDLGAGGMRRDGLIDDLAVRRPDQHHLRRLGRGVDPATRTSSVM